VETTSDNRRTVGIFVPNAAVDTVLQGFFLSLSILTPFLKSTPAHVPALEMEIFPITTDIKFRFKKKKCCSHVFQLRAYIYQYSKLLNCRQFYNEILNLSCTYKHAYTCAKGLRNFFFL